MRVFREYSLYFAWAIAILATCGSLYFSEVLLYEPCKLCWFQRILMYPLVLILGIAAYTNEKLIKKYVLPMTILGGCISLYHYTLQHSPFLQKHEMCNVGIPCSGIYIELLGFITIPFMALIAFTLITVILIFTKRESK